MRAAFFFLNFGISTVVGSMGPESEKIMFESLLCHLLNEVCDLGNLIKLH